MPIHDWTRVDAGVFHDFHGRWGYTICDALNDGVLPDGYIAMAEQVADRNIADVLALHTVGPRGRGADAGPPTGGAAVSVPAKTQFHETATVARAARRQAARTRSVVVRHVTGNRVVAVVEIVSPGNKSCRRDFRSFVDKVVRLIDAGVHLLVVDLFPPGTRDPQGVHRAIWEQLSRTRFALPAGQRLTLASYLASPPVEAFVETVAVGDALPAMPLYLTPDVHVPVPLEPSYQTAWARVLKCWRDVIDPPAGGTA